jgi:hypothetical protein
MRQNRSIVVNARMGPERVHRRSRRRAIGVRPWRHGMRRLGAVAAAVSLLPGLDGCYTYKQSVTTAVQPGADVSLTITDQGRVGLGNRLGRGVLRVNGRVVNSRDSSDSVWVVQVSSVEMLAGQKTHWAGEEVRLPREYVSDVATREFSRGRTWLAVGVTVAAVALAIGTASLVAGGSESDDTKPPPDGQTSRSPASVNPTPAAAGSRP